MLNRQLALLTLCAGMLMIILDTTIVSVAQPSIQADLGFSAAGLAWVVNAYLIAFGGLLLLAGRLGDLLGRARVFQAGLALFTLASLLCGLATSQELLIAARFLQGAGGALTSAVVLGMIVAMYDEPGERTRAIAVYAFVGSAGASLGLVLGGLLTDALSWHWIFFVNVPIGLATLLAARRVLADEPGLGLRGGADVPGALLIVAALMLGVYTLVEAGGAGWGSAQTLGLGAVALALLAAFAARERSAAQPLTPLRLFTVPNVAAANLVQTVMIAGMFGQQFFVALYLQLVLGFDATEVGLGMLPIALAIGLFSLGLSTRAIARAGAKGVLVGGLLLIAAGLMAIQRAPVDGLYWRDVLPALLVMGAGAGLAMPALPTLAMARSTPADAGLASGLLNTTQQIGAAIGLSLLATLAASRSETLRAGGEGAVVALAGGYRLAFAVAAGLALAAAALAVALLRGERAVAPGAPAPAAEHDLYAAGP
ncbi:DHA2 family efflux MFS transporter permease subunit [Conexibacter stalactiti]|uniref:DHA2 family efflux MFS transporter permease subunit n=1 Tax=Conexibacter stalactiti TaxID=1940611 RepID=A0ABU4HPT2_9ACTN|nr:DHA2 family efflux MFS transporter permease subunit [Conexibacter stalactiti]MDW5594734.1 DHA2 family efflux MFS transporter permease subunit [Conexibacter stalactiti]MEC5035376.1 DHA2 family efflux MFS transporter permease subunit [Conexibacter stalactiti]